MADAAGPVSAAVRDGVIAIARAAADAILAIYAEDFDVLRKADASPVTAADLAAHRVIVDGLRALTPDIPIVSEESAVAVPAALRRTWNRMWLVDPLDGTREFVKRNGEFTVNIALVEQGRPVMGVVLAPATGEIFVGDADGAWSGIVVDGVVTKRRVIAVRQRARPLIVASRSHGHAALHQLCQSMDVESDVSVGSSLKFCLLARGDAQLYPRFTPTCEWDIAAGQAVLEAAGGAVLTLDGQSMTYGKGDSTFLNPFFVAASSLALAQKAAQEMRQLLG